MRKVNPRAMELARRQGNRELPEPRRKMSRPKPAGFANPTDIDFSFLEGDFGRQVLEEYNQEVSRDYHDASALRVLSFSDNVVKGSNPPAFVFCRTS